jgi:hypothetical protein
MTEAARCVTAGVDTHRDVHMVAVLDERDAELGCEAFAADPAGYRKAIAWVRAFGPIERSASRAPDPMVPGSLARTEVLPVGLVAGDWIS